MIDFRDEQLEAARNSVLSRDPDLAELLADYSEKRRDYHAQRKRELVGKGLQAATGANSVNRIL